MGIRLNWEIEAEKERVETAGEDPETRRRRWRARLRLLGLLLLFVGLVGLVVGGVILRLRQVDWEIEQALRDTVDAEIATLRLGDRAAFLTFQRSATDEWSQRQNGAFEDYQELKLQADVELSGEISSVLVDRQRARVQVQEVIDGARYVQTWFYWNYDDGWRHVPPDYTFWGEERTLSSDNVTVYYRALDEPFAQVLLTELTLWVTGGCSALGCGQMPHLTVEVVPNPTLGWIEDWHLRVPSPYIGRARIDQPLEATVRFQAAALIARSLVDDIVGDVLTGEGGFLQEAVVRWLVERFALVQMNSHVIYSLAARYGDAAVGRLVTQLTPDSTAAVLASVTGTSLEQSGLDWRDYIAWRLTDVYSGQDYDVTSALVEYSPEGIPQIQAVVRIGGDEMIVLFQLVDGVWERVT